MDIKSDRRTFLKLASRQQIEELFAAAEFHVRVNLDAVLALHQRVQALMEKDRL